MHVEAYAGFGRMLTASGWNPSGGRTTVLDIGGADINGTVHDQLPAGAVVYVADAHPGPHVDAVVDCTHPQAADLIQASFGLTTFDLIISTEVLEHTRGWRTILATAARLLAPTGALIVTCASTGRGPHGAWGDAGPGPGEWYDNVDPNDLRAALQELFDTVYVEYQAHPGDAYAYATTPKDPA